jgi:hypothetical protein
MERPDPYTEIQLVSLRNLRGANFWSRRPVTRVDLAVGAYDQISSADVAGFTEALAAAFPGLVEHRCSVGERGGFLVRLRDGTYAPHIMEHLALELQTTIGHGIGYGRARGGDRPGEYTVVFAHAHAEVGLRAAAHALELVQCAFAGRALSVEPALDDLRRAAAEPDVPPLTGRARCLVTGTGARGEVRDALLRRWGGEAAVIDVSPAYLLNVGLPVARADLAIVLGDRLTDVPERYRDPERAAQLLSVVADALEPGGIVILPASAREVRERVHDGGWRIALFSVQGEIPRAGREAAHAAAWVREGRVAVERGGALRDAGQLRPHLSPMTQLVQALAEHAMEGQDV